ncbi:AAWKG family protein [Streptomyces sp. NPDC056486]|uniref:AAWKG family protein n=1 Tax=Streptomyces sp. NPDC056486 TaxID=3345835 RepID=UPI0036C83731
MAEDTGIDGKHDDYLGYGADAKDVPGDTWGDLVAHITGYPVPKRAVLFDTLRSDKGGKLFRMDFQEKSIKDAVEDSTGFAMNSDDDYDIWFFDKDKTMSVKQARIVFEGRVKSGDEVIFASADSDNVNDASVRSGGEFTDYNDDKMDSRPLAQYMSGPRAALMALLEGNTQGTDFSGASVSHNDAVVLKSFDDTGESFDYAAKFFKDQAPILKEWEDRFGADDASWKGEAADVFRSLLEKIRENYDNYVETFNSAVGGGSGTSTDGTVYSRALALGRTYLEDAARDLLAAWLKWANSRHYDPHQVLRYVLDDLATWVNENNVKKTDIEAIGPYYFTYMHSPHSDFTQVHDYGDLTDAATWKKVGDKAVEIWFQGIDKDLGEEAAKVQSRLNNHFIDLSKDFSGNIPKPKTTSTASEDYKDKKADDATDAANKANADAAAAAKKAADDAKKANDENKAAAKEAADEAKKANAENKAAAKEAADELKKQRAEDKADAAKARADADAAAKANSKAFQDGMSGLNGPGGGGGNQKLNLDDLLNPGGNQNNANHPPTESLGNLGNLNGPGGGPGGLNSPGGGLGDSNSPGGGGGQQSVAVPPIPQNLGNLGNLNGPGGGLGGLNSPGGDGAQQRAAMPPVPQNLGNLGNLNNPGGGLGGINGGANTPLKSPTGGSTQLGDNKQITADFPDGSSSAFDPDSGTLTTTNPDGSTTTQNLGDGTKVTNPDGSVTSLGDDGKLTTSFPDGTTQNVDPTTGQAVTTDPDGKTTTQNLGSLGNINGGNSAGGLGDLNGGNGTADLGNLGDINPGMDTQSNGDLGNLGNLGDLNNIGDLNNNQSGLETPTGGHTSLDGNDFTTKFADGGKATFDPDTGMLTSTDADGSTKLTDLTHGAQVTNPDGSVTSLDNGEPSTTFPDGSKQKINPDTGIATLTDPQGGTKTIDLHDLNSVGDKNNLDIPNSLDIPNGVGGGGGGGTTNRDVTLPDLNTGGSGGSGVGAGGGSPVSVGAGAGLNGGSGSLDGLGAGGAAPLSDGASANSPAASSSGSGTPGAPGTPGSPGMPMGGGGMGGMGAGGEKGNGERVRSVLVDAVEESERRNRRGRRSPWNRQEDSDTFLAPASRVTTTGGDSSEEEAESGRRATTSADYLEEDADVWGTEEGGTPSVIGR